MAVRRVEIRVTSTGFDEAIAKTKLLNTELDKLRGKLDGLGRRIISPKITLDGIVTDNLQLDKLNAKLDNVGRKRVTAKVDVDVDSSAFGKLQRLFFGKKFLGLGNSGGGSGVFKNLAWDLFGWMGKGTGGGSITSAAGATAGGAAAGGGAGAAGLGAALGPVGMGIAGAAIGSVLPALIPLLLGLGVGGVGVLGAYKIDPKAFKAPVADLKKAFLSALTQQGSTGTPERFGNRFGGAIPEPSFLQGVLGILKQIDGFIKQVGPQLGAMFRASLPFLDAFVKGMEYFGKLILPIVTQTLKSFAPFLPIISAGFQALAQGIAYFIKDLGPGMKDASIIFRAVMIAIKGILIAVAYVMDGLAIGIVKIAEAVKWLAHEARRWFDIIRHDVAHWADELRQIFNHVTQTIMTWAHDAVRWFDDFRHKTANVFDGVRHDIAHIWDEIWNNTIGRIIRGVGDVGRWFTNMKLKIGSILSGLPGDLYRIGASIISSLVSGLKAAAGPLISFINWVKGLISSIGGFLGLGGGGGFQIPGGIPGGGATGGIGKIPAMGLSPLRSAPAASSPVAGAAGPMFLVVNFNGVVGDPDAVARQVHQVLRDYKKHRGNMALGLA